MHGSSMKMLPLREVLPIPLGMGSEIGWQGVRGARSEMWTQRLLKGTPRYYDRFGASLAAGDFNGDGDDELAVGVPGFLVV